MAAPSASVPVHLHERFEIVEELGIGGYSKVYRAKERATGRPVALKILKKAFLNDPEILERFRREIFAVASISSPHVVALYDFGMSGEDFFIAMEQVSGCSLRDIILTHTWSAHDIYVVVGQIAEALAAAHKVDIVHRDLKPENVMLANVDRKKRAHRVKVLDFGFAKLGEMENSLQLAELTRAGTTLGTPQYMSPEQSRGKPAQPSMDLFALGVIVYELLTGGPPWDGNDPVQVMTAVVKDPLPPLASHLSGAHVTIGRVAELSAFVERALDKEAGDRFADAESFLRGLEVALFEKPLAESGFEQATNDLVAIPSAPELPDASASQLLRIDATIAMTSFSESKAAPVMGSAIMRSRRPSLPVVVLCVAVTALVALTGLALLWWRPLH